MNRRDFFKKIGIAAAAAAVVPALPLLVKKETETFAGLYKDASIRYFDMNEKRMRTFVFRDWKPSTVYYPGDRIRFSNGLVTEPLQFGGTSCSTEMWHGTVLPLKGFNW